MDSFDFGLIASFLKSGFHETLGEVQKCRLKQYEYRENSNLVLITVPFLALDVVYQPKTLYGAADEVLSVLKNEKIKSSDKEEIEKLLNSMSNQLFDQLVSIGRLIKDYQDGGGDAVGPVNAASDEALDVDIGVAVEFEEDEEEEDSDYDQVQEEEGDGPELNGNEAMQMGGIDGDDVEEETNEGLMLTVQDIDAYWLQSKISQAYEKIDPLDCQKLLEDVLRIVAEGGDDSDVENGLVLGNQMLQC